MGDIRVFPLSEKPEFVDTCAAWEYAEWGCQYKNKSLSEWVTYFGNFNNELPVTWVAVFKDKPVGMVGLDKEEHPDYKNLFPWLSTLYVHPFFRNQGVAHMLHTHVLECAKNDLGFDHLFLSTRSAVDFYKKRDWALLKMVRDPAGLQGEEKPLMKKTL